MKRINYVSYAEKKRVNITVVALLVIFVLIVPSLFGDGNAPKKVLINGEEVFEER